MKNPQSDELPNSTLIPLLTLLLPYIYYPLDFIIATHPPDFGIEPSAKAAPQIVDSGL